MKKLALIVLITFCAASIFASGTDASQPMTVDKVTALGWDGLDYDQESFNDTKAFIADRFGLEIDMSSMTGMHNPGAMEKPELIWASGDYPDFFDFYIQRMEAWNFPGIWDKVIDWNDHLDKVPNVRAHFSQAEWDDAIKRRKRPDGKLPYLFGHNYRVALTAWVYESTTFDNLGINPPKTTDDLYKALQVLRAEYPEPEHFLISSRNNFAGILNGIAYAFRVDTGLRIDSDAISMAEPYFWDTDTNKLTFGGIDDKYLNALKFAKKLMDEGLAPDMTTAMDEGIYWNEAATTLKFFMSYGPTKDANGMFTQQTREKAPDAVWKELLTPITAYADKVSLVPYNPPDYDNGVIITDKPSAEVRDKIIKFIDFMAEIRPGTIWGYEQMFAVNDWLGGPNWIVNNDPKIGRIGARLPPKEWSLREASASYSSEKSPWAGEHGDGAMAGWPPPAGWPHRTPFISDVYQAYDPFLLYAEAIKDGSGEFIKKIVWARTPEEDEKLKELEGAMSDIIANFVRGFLKGEVSEAAWDDYKRDVKKAGLDEAMALRQKIYDRNN